MPNDGDKLAADIAELKNPLAVQKEIAIALHRIAICLEEGLEVQLVAEALEDIESQVEGVKASIKNLTTTINLK